MEEATRTGSTKSDPGKGNVHGARLYPGPNPELSAAVGSLPGKDGESANASVASSSVDDNDSWGSDFESREFSRTNRESAYTEDFYEPVEDQVRVLSSIFQVLTFWNQWLTTSVCRAPQEKS